MKTSAAILLMCFTGSIAAAAGPSPPRSGLIQPRTCTTNKCGSWTITNRSDRSSVQPQPFGNGPLQRDQPGRSW